MSPSENRRILLIDDTPAIHDDFRKILVRNGATADLDRLQAALFGAAAGSAGAGFELECARQGREGLARVREALQAARPYAVAFVDMRMPPGWDGVETIEHLWQADPGLQIVICTAYADFNRGDILRLAVGDRLLILKKPFDAVELWQLACALSAKWNATRQAQLKMAQLEKLVRLRDSQLESLNLELLRARDQAKEASRAKREFLANMSHEVRTPMNTVLGMTQLVLQTDLTPKQQQYLESSLLAAQSLMGTINDILDLSRVESGQLELELSEFLLEELLERLSLLMTGKAELKRLQLEIDAAPECLRPLVGDPHRLGQVLINLCDNAVKFTDAGKVALRVRAAGEAAERLTLRFSVHDTGVGIGEEELKRLFAPFSQLDASSTRKNGGAGMGLAIAHELVQLMGGELRVASEAGRGSEFSFCLTLGLGQTAQMRRPGSVRKQGEATGLPELAGISVTAGLAFCCEDMQLYRKLLVRFLETSSAATAEIEVDLAGGDRQAAARAARTMTSVAGTIGARRLSEAAGALEQAIKGGEPEALATRLEEFDRQLSQVVASLRVLKPRVAGDPAGTRAAGKKRLDHQAVRGMLDRMSALFDCDLNRALALKELLHKELEGSILADEFGRMERQIAIFDFAGALKSRERMDRILEMAGEQAKGRDCGTKRRHGRIHGRRI
ncbi:MAG: hypothetical protein A2075_13420 [Geobacteraceae bacterium GWC2_58_44]|nr:MAG: hypothetical protein A2075_13420 [Geobacteraceae bacterium GWC2_58_44]